MSKNKRKSWAGSWQHQQTEGGMVKMARKALDINIRIERQEKKILQLADQLEEAKDQYDKLIQEKKKEDEKKLLEAYRKSKRSLDEVIDFLKGKADI